MPFSPYKHGIQTDTTTPSGVAGAAINSNFTVIGDLFDGVDYHQKITWTPTSIGTYRLATGGSSGWMSGEIRFSAQSGNTRINDDHIEFVVWSPLVGGSAGSENAVVTWIRQPSASTAAGVLSYIKPGADATAGASGTYLDVIVGTANVPITIELWGPNAPTLNNPPTFNPSAPAFSRATAFPINRNYGPNGIYTTGNVQATYFVGSGQYLTNLPTSPTPALSQVLTAGDDVAGANIVDSLLSSYGFSSDIYGQGTFFGGFNCPYGTGFTLQMNGNTVMMMDGNGSGGGTIYMDGGSLAFDGSSGMYSDGAGAVTFNAASVNLGAVLTVNSVVWNPTSSVTTLTDNAVLGINGFNGATLVTAASNVTGITVSYGSLVTGSVVTVVNQSNYTITFAASNSHIADGSASPIPARTSRIFVMGNDGLLYRCA